MASAPKKKRNFNENWMKTYPWLVCDEQTESMKCNHCLHAKKSNPFATSSGCTNFQNSTLKRHQESKDHADAVSQLKLRTDFKKCFAVSKSSDVKTKQHITQLRTVYVMCKNNIAADNFTMYMYAVNLFENLKIKFLHKSFIIFALYKF